MKVLFMIVGVLFVIIGGVLGYLGYRFRYYKPKYQFEKTTTGRTVRFLDHIEAKRYERNKTFGMLMLAVSIMIFGIGLFMVIYVCLN
jgi:uncharacterized membrane protein YidH (DUF202 family)